MWYLFVMLVYTVEYQMLTYTNILCDISFGVFIYILIQVYEYFYIKIKFLYLNIEIKYDLNDFI